MLFGCVSGSAPIPAVAVSYQTSSAQIWNPVDLETLQEAAHMALRLVSTQGAIEPFASIIWPSIHL